MPLSEHEQRQLEAIERALYADDPKFAHTVKFTNPRAHGRRRLIAGLALVVLGLAVVLGGVISSMWYLGLVGFLVMLGGATRAYGGIRRLTGQAGRDAQAGNARGTNAGAPGSHGLRGRLRRSPQSGGWRERFEERWNRRFDGP